MFFSPVLDKRNSNEKPPIIIKANKSLKPEPRVKGKHDLYEPVHEIWSYRICANASLTLTVSRGARGLKQFSTFVLGEFEKQKL